ncbi:MAG: hypothetical protein KatS3mg131_1359 [Candidatus Tectimicrobiota bacterium]|nr:MAG: hypothetical protein KatS3mg131_1359 [Candidatus Tectomicrobia bacterium]
MSRRCLPLSCLACLFVFFTVWGHEHGHPSPHGQEAAPAKGPVRLTMEELHRLGGVPPGWRFTLPPGDPEAGRQVFIDLKCYTCHTVAGEQFPAHPRDVGDVGPDLTGMGAHHPAEYFAETIINPNAVIVLGEGYTGPDGLSRMPEYNDILTVRQLIDLVAYLKSLQAPPPQAGAPAGHHGSHQPGHHMPDMPGRPAGGQPR